MIVVPHLDHHIETPAENFTGFTPY